jgi:hypothetical protein
VSREAQQRKQREDQLVVHVVEKKGNRREKERFGRQIADAESQSWREL